MTLSVVIITLNEEHNIGRCLEAVGFAHERIVYDTGSTDQTCEIARALGCRVINGVFDGFGSTKQRALSLASADWVLSLDADEVVSDDLAKEIALAIESTDKAGFEINRKTLFLGRWITHGGWYPDWVLRLARRDRVTFSSRLVHEGMTLDGNRGHLTGELLHYSYPSLEQYLEKGNRYTTLGAREISSQKRVRLTHLLVHPWWQFVKQYLLKLGFLDGWQGLVLAALSATQVMTKYAKARVIQEKKIMSKNR